MYETTDALFTGICDAIREKDGTTEPIRHQQIPARIAAISGGGEFTSAFYTYKDRLKIENMVVSGFGAGHAIYTPEAFMPGDKPWVIQTKFRLSENSAKSRNFIVGVDSANKVNCPFIAVRDNNTAISAGIPNASGDNYIQQIANYEFSIDIDYWIRYIREKTEYILQISTNGSDYENIIQFDCADEPYQDNTSILRFGNYRGSHELAGSIDLKETYIKIGDEIWWGRG